MPHVHLAAEVKHQHLLRTTDTDTDSWTSTDVGPEFSRVTVTRTDLSGRQQRTVRNFPPLVIVGHQFIVQQSEDTVGFNDRVFKLLVLLWWTGSYRTVEKKNIFKLN